MILERLAICEIRFEMHKKRQGNLTLPSPPMVRVIVSINRTLLDVYIALHKLW
jgi:hypothetical protein